LPVEQQLKWILKFEKHHDNASAEIDNIISERQRQKREAKHVAAGRPSTAGEKTLHEFMTYNEARALVEILRGLPPGRRKGFEAKLADARVPADMRPICDDLEAARDLRRAELVMEAAAPEVVAPLEASPHPFFVEPKGPLGEALRTTRKSGAKAIEDMEANAAQVMGPIKAECDALVEKLPRLPLEQEQAKALALEKPEAEVTVLEPVVDLPAALAARQALRAFRVWREDHGACPQLAELQAELDRIEKALGEEAVL
jgi:hypothetical protein